MPILLTVINKDILMASHTKGLYTHIHSKEVLLIKLFVVIVDCKLILVVILNYLINIINFIFSGSCVLSCFSVGRILLHQCTGNSF